MPVVAQEAKDYLGVPGPIAFDGQDYRLAWSSQPTGEYTGGYVLSTPVSGRMRSVSYEGCFRIDEREFEAVRADPDSAEQFLEECRNDHHADRRIEHTK